MTHQGWLTTTVLACLLVSCSAPAEPPPESTPPTSDVARPTPPIEAEPPAPDPTPDPTRPEPTRDKPPAPPADEPLAVEVPETAAEARALWERQGERVLPLLATYFQLADFRPADDDGENRDPAQVSEELQTAFDLVRDIAISVPLGSPAADHVAEAILGFIRLPPTAMLPMPGEEQPLRWSGLIELVVGLRPAAELGPALTGAVRRRVHRDDSERLQPPSPSELQSDLLRGALYASAYLAYSPASELIRWYASGLANDPPQRLLALAMLTHLRDWRGAGIAERVLRDATDAHTASAAARTLVLLGREEAEDAVASLLRRDDPALQRQAVGPLLTICTASSLARIMHLEQNAEDEEKWTRSMIASYVRRYSREVKLTPEELGDMMRNSPGDAARLLRPYARRLELLADDDRRITHEDALAAIDSWTEAETIHTEAWPWVRDRHILSVASPADIPRLENARRAILGQVRGGALGEASTVQRMIAAVQAAHER